MSSRARALLVPLLTLACAAAHAQAPGGGPLPPLWEGPTRAADDGLPRASQRYVLEAELDAARARVAGRARITLTNTSARPLEVLVLHLYLNAFRDRDSVFMRESGGALRGSRARGSGGLALHSLRADGEDLLDGAERELVRGDLTQLRVALPRPLVPGSTLTLESEFEARLPPLFARSGYVDGFFAVAQWFPKLAKLEPDGQFASFPYHALGEFYADFADYALTVRADPALAVVAGGAEVESFREGALAVHRFAARHVHDLAFFAGRGFERVAEQVDGVRVIYLAPPGYTRAVRAHAEVVRAGLQELGRAFGRYPYPALTVVLPPRGAAGAAGMEYPTLFVSDGSWLPVPGLPSLSGAFVTAHELAHQWFYGLFASDEVRFPVLDEGLAQWASLDLMRGLYGAQEGIGGLAFDRFEAERFLSLRVLGSVAPGRPAHAYTPSEYAGSVYGRAALALESIRRAHGRARFDQALARYADRARFRHPTPRDLAEAFDAVYGAGFSARTLEPLLLDGASAAVRLVELRSGRRGQTFWTSLRARREGVALPTWAAAYAGDGRELVRVRWPASIETLATTLETREPVARVVLDPERALLLDPEVGDQVRTLGADATGEQASRRFVACALGWVQLLASWVGP